MSKYDDVIRRRLEPEPAVQSILRDMALTQQRWAVEDAQKDPKKYKLSTIIADGKPASARYWRGGKNAEGEQVDYGYACWKNIAGYYLSWREIENPTEIKRDRFCAHRTRKRASGFAKECADLFQGETR